MADKEAAMLEISEGPRDPEYALCRCMDGTFENEAGTFVCSHCSGDPAISRR